MNTPGETGHPSAGIRDRLSDELRLAWRNIWRNTRRSALTMMAVGFAAALLVFMLSFQLGCYEEMINASVRLHTGHIQVQATGYFDDGLMRQVVANPDAVMKTAGDIPGVTAVTARSEAFALAAGPERTRGALVTGVLPAREAAISDISRFLVRGKTLNPDDTGTAVIGHLLAKRLDIDTGDEITFLGSGRDGSVAAHVATVSGIIRTGMDRVDRVAAQIPMADFDAAFSMRGGAHRIIIMCDRLLKVPAIARRLTSDLSRRTELDPSSLAVWRWDDLSPDIKQGIQLDLVSGMVMYVILLTVVAFSILNTFIMAVFERTREFGVLMAIGMRPGALVRLMMMESTLMSALGLAAGMAIGAAVTIWLQNTGISMGGSAEMLAQYGFTGRLHPRLSLVSLVAGPSLICVITLITALIPALRIPRLKPVEALRSGSL